MCIFDLSLTIKHNVMTTEERNAMIKIQTVLSNVQNGTPVFFNLVVYKKLGLIIDTCKYGINSVGNKVVVGTNYTLTAKAKQIVNTIF